MTHIRNIPSIGYKTKNIIFFEDRDLIGKSIEIIKKIQQKNKEILELKEIAYYDKLTGLLNREGLEKEIKERFKNGEHISLIVFDIENLGIINNDHGYINGGDDSITTTSNLLKKYFRQNGKTKNSDIICRYGGDEFIVISKKINKKILEQKIQNIKIEILKINNTKIYKYGLHIEQNDDHTIDNFEIATEEGFKKAKDRMVEVT